MRNLIFFISLFFILAACDQEPEFRPQESFVRVFNDPGTDRDYHPTAIMQSRDGGYLILSAFDEWDTYVMKINSQGRFLWDRNLDASLVNPVGQFFHITDSVYFMCMNRQNREARVMRVDEFNQSVIEEVNYQGLINPLDVKQDENGNILVLSHQTAANAFGLSLIDPSFVQRWGRLYDTGADYASLVENHMRKRIEPLPFFCGSMSNNQSYFFNSVFEDSLSLVFATPTTGEFSGMLRGIDLTHAVSGAAHLEGSSFFLSHYQFNQFRIASQQVLNNNNITNISEIGGRVFPDLRSSTRSIIKELTLNGQRVICFATPTIDLNARLNFYDASSGNLLNSILLGQGNPFTIADVEATSDGGVVVLGATRVAGRLSRIMVIKLSERETLNI